MIHQQTQVREREKEKEKMEKGVVKWSKHKIRAKRSSIQYPTLVNWMTTFFVSKVTSCISFQKNWWNKKTT